MKSLVIRLSTGSTSSDELTTQQGSLGGKMATRGSSGVVYQLSSNTYPENVIFDDITASENVAEIPEYRCVYIYNNGSIDGARGIIGAKVYISGSTYAKFELGLVQSKNTDATIISNETTFPALINFESYNKDKKLSIGDLNVNDRIALWIKRTPKNVGGAGLTKEALTIVIEGAQ